MFERDIAELNCNRVGTQQQASFKEKQRPLQHTALDTVLTQHDAHSLLLLLLVVVLVAVLLLLLLLLT
jgi:hypothetical protein